METLELHTAGLVEQGGGGRVLDQGQVAPRVVLLENLLAESDEEDDEDDDDKQHHGDADQLLLANHGVSGLHVGDDDGPQAAALAHEPGGAVAVEGAGGVDADAAVLTLPLGVVAVTFVHVFLTPAAWREDGGKRRLERHLVEERRHFCWNSHQAPEASPAAAEERVPDGFAHSTVLTGVGDAHGLLHLTVSTSELVTTAAGKA